MEVQTISMLAMQVMVDLVMDLLDRIATEAASILELEGKDTLTWRSRPAQDSHCETARTASMHANITWRSTSSTTPIKSTRNIWPE